jgi:endonuclease/exonuclease/phosphatase (EEP) superfamily protein YafD
MRSNGTASADAEQVQVAELAAKISDLPLPKNAQSGNTTWWSTSLISLAWLGTIGLATFAILRFAYHDGAYFLIWINAFTRYVYLPAYACLLLAVWKRRRWLALASAAIVCCHLYWMAPDIMRDRGIASAPNTVVGDARPKKTIRIFFANVQIENRERGAMLREIRDANPDVVVLVEFWLWWRYAFVHSPLIANYPFGAGLSLEHPGGNSVNIFSRLPLKSEQREWVAGRSVEIVEIPIGSQSLQLVGLHAPRPMEIRDNDYNGYWTRVVPLLLGMKGPLVVVGDCNATQYSRVYQQLKAGGLRSAHEDQGRGYATTWPNGQYPVPPIRIDQAFLSPEVKCLGISEGRGQGSDHKPLILDVALPDAP